MKELIDKYEKLKVAEYTNNVLSKRPLVSVLVATYNHKNYIKECIDGILIQQTDFPIEILLGDDDSNDGTRDICKRYVQKYPDKIRLFLHHRENNIKINGNPTGRFNFIYNIYNSRGKYIALCEGDDYWTDPLKLQKQVDFLEKNKDYVITYHNSKTINENGILISNSELPDNLKRDFSQWELITQPYLLLQTMCFRNIIKTYPKEFSNILNGDTFLISLLGNYGKGKYMTEVHDARYRKHNLGIWSMKGRFYQNLSQLQTYQNLEKYYKKLGKQEVAAYFSKRNKQQLIALIEEISSNKETLMVTKLFLRENNIKNLCLFLFYSLSSTIFGRGYFLKKKLHDSINFSDKKMLKNNSL